MRFSFITLLTIPTYVFSDVCTMLIFKSVINLILEVVNAFLWDILLEKKGEKYLTYILKNFLFLNIFLFKKLFFLFRNLPLLTHYFLKLHMVWTLLWTVHPQLLCPQLVLSQMATLNPLTSPTSTHSTAH